MPEIGGEIDSKTLYELYQREWQTVIATPMHFNDLMIRFRAMTLTAFAALVGASVTLGQVMNFSGMGRQIMLALPIVFWIVAGLLDPVYYHRLLLDAVSQAAKFDGAKVFTRIGLFGLTSAIATSIKPRLSYGLVILYYLVPLAAIGSIVLAGLTWHAGEVRGSCATAGGASERCVLAQVPRWLPHSSSA